MLTMLMYGIGIFIVALFVLSFLPFWGVKFRFFYKQQDGTDRFDPWMKSGDTTNMSYWGIRCGEITVKSNIPQKRLDVFRNCGNIQFKVVPIWWPF